MKKRTRPHRALTRSFQISWGKLIRLVLDFPSGRTRPEVPYPWQAPWALGIEPVLEKQRWEDSSKPYGPGPRPWLGKIDPMASLWIGRRR